MSAQTDESTSGPFPLCSVLLALFELEGDCVIGLGRLVCNCALEVFELCIPFQDLCFFSMFAPVLVEHCLFLLAHSWNRATEGKRLLHGDVCVMAGTMACVGDIGTGS